MKCGCTIATEHNALSGWEGDHVIVFCPLHSAAEEMLAHLKELRRTIDDDHWYADDLTVIIAKASQPVKEK